MITNKFSIIHKIRNKIRIRGSNHKIILEDGSKTNIKGSNISIKGYNHTLHIKKNTRIKNINIQITGKNCKIIIGNDVIIGYNSYISAREEGTVLEIDDGAMLSKSAKIMTADGHAIYENGKITNEARSIYIGKKVWIADNVTVLKGVSIGEGSIVGINSTLTKSIPNNVIAIGNPARVKKVNIKWEH